MSEFDQTSLHDELEVRVIALLTGELGETEADELEKILAINPDLSAYRDRMAELMGELHQARDEIAPPSGEPQLQLTQERRAQIFGDTRVLDAKPKRKRIWMNPALWGVAASIAVVFAFSLLSTIKFQSAVMREETVFESMPVAVPAQKEPEYTVNMEQRNRSTPPPRPPEMTVNAPTDLEIPPLDIDVNTDSSSVYGRSGGGFGGGFGGGLADIREMDVEAESNTSESVTLREGVLKSEDYSRFSGRNVADNIKIVRAGEVIPVDIPKELIEGTPQPVRLPNLERRATQAPRMVVRPESELGKSDGFGGNKEGGLSIQASDMDVTFFGYAADSKQNSENQKKLGGELASPDRDNNLEQRSSGNRGVVTSGPVDPFAAPATESDFSGAWADQQDSRGERSKVSGPVDPFAAPAPTGPVKSREKLLRQVEQSWERPKVFDVESEDREVQVSGYSSKLNDIVIPQVNFKGVPMSQVVETLNELSVAYDPEQKGVQLKYQPLDGHDPKVNISLRNLNIDRILQFVTQQVNYSYDVGGDVILIQPSDSLAGVSNMVTEYFPVSRETVARLAGYMNDDISSSGVSETQALQSFFQNAGINPELPGTSLAFDGEKLIVTQTRRNIERMRTILRHYGDKYKAEKTAETVRLTPKPEKLAAEEPFSTFSLNISDVSFKLAQAALQNSRVPPASQIRTEEFVNSFDYGDPSPRSDEPVALHWEMAQHPFEHDRQVVRFSLQTQASGRTSGQALNISLLVDNSGSMQRPDRQAILQKSLQTLEQKLTPQDNLNIILFARQPRLIAEAQTRASQKAAVETALAYRPEGGTNLEAGLHAAYESARRNYVSQGSNRVILMTDGAANLGNVNAGDLAEYVVEQRKQGIALDAYGIGWDDYNDALLEEITRNGDGRYAFLNSVEEASDDFSEKLAGTLRVAASNVKVQIEWNPDRVQRYRQIGYDLHQLKKEDFRDNTVDAAEIGEAESGTALYVMKINDDPKIIGGLGTLHVRYLDPVSGLYKEHSWPLPMPRQVKAANAASPSMRLAMSSAFFGERLANSPYAGGYSFNDLYRLMSGLPEAFPNQPRVNQMQAMLLQASELYEEK